MKIQIEQIIYFYMFICIAMLVFDILFALSRKGVDRRQNRRKERFLLAVERQMEHLRADGTMDLQLEKKMAGKLKNYHNLMAFHQAVLSLQEEKKPVSEYLIKSRSMFLELAYFYSKANDMKKAYFAYLMGQYQIDRGEEHSELSHILLSFVNSSNVYCRENALTALYRFGNPVQVARAFRRLNEEQIPHHGKLLTDGLLSFTGEHQELCRLLWEQFDEWDTKLQVVFINYVRMISGEYGEVFEQRLKNKKTDKEVKLAILRYFRKWNRPPIKPCLQDYIIHADQYDWEMTALASLALQNYPGKDTVEVLKMGLHHKNWYVRLNSAQSLQKLRASYMDLADIYNGEDRFAREMLVYHMQKAGE